MTRTRNLRLVELYKEHSVRIFTRNALLLKLKCCVAATREKRTVKMLNCSILTEYLIDANATLGNPSVTTPLFRREDN